MTFVRYGEYPATEDARLAEQRATRETLERLHADCEHYRRNPRDMWANLDCANDQRRRDLCAATVTLNGKPASIGGVKEQFATVGALDMSTSAQWDWQTAERIISEGGDFWSIERPRQRRRR